MENLHAKIQEHRGADTGFRNKPENITRECEKITHKAYGYTMDKPPFYSPSKKTFQLHHKLRRKFLTVNFVFDDNGRKIRVV